MGALLDQKLTLLTMELKHEGAVVVRNLLILLVGAVFATLGLMLFGMAAALWIGAVIKSVPGGYDWETSSPRGPTSPGLLVAMSTDPPAHWTSGQYDRS